MTVRRRGAPGIDDEAYAEAGVTEGGPGWQSDGRTPRQLSRVTRPGRRRSDVRGSARFLPPNTPKPPLMLPAKAHNPLAEGRVLLGEASEVSSIGSRSSRRVPSRMGRLRREPTFVGTKSRVGRGL